MHAQMQLITSPYCTPQMYASVLAHATLRTDGSVESCVFSCMEPCTLFSSVSVVCQDKDYNELSTDEEDYLQADGTLYQEDSEASAGSDLSDDNVETESYASDTLSELAREDSSDVEPSSGEHHL